MTSGRYEPLRVAFIGVGNWSKALATALSKSKKLLCTSCFDLNPAASQSFSGVFGCKVAESYEEILDDSGVEGLILVTPNSSHAELTVAAAQAGKHIFCEKPIANTVADGRRMLEACERAGVVLSIAHLQRRMGAFRKMKAMLGEGALGQVLQAEASFGQPRGLILTREMWRFFEQECPGGAMMTLGVHHADNLQYLLGPVRRVSALANRVAVPAEINDVGAAVLEFENGALGYLGTNYAAPPNWALSLMGTGGNLHLRIKMTRLSPEDYYGAWERSDERAELTFHRAGGEPEPHPFDKWNILLAELEEFADCVRLGGQPEVGAKEGLAALAVILAANRSAAEGRAVEINEVLGQGDN
ncbi:MAG: Gfo/Idh/MocA family protein [Nitrospinota bacterium]